MPIKSLITPILAACCFAALSMGFVADTQHSRSGAHSGGGNPPIHEVEPPRDQQEAELHELAQHLEDIHHKIRALQEEDRHELHIRKEAFEPQFNEQERVMMHLEELRRKIEHLHHLGKHEQARELEMEAHHLMQMFEDEQEFDPDRERLEHELVILAEKIDFLYEEGRDEEAIELELRADQIIMMLDPDDIDQMYFDDDEVWGAMSPHEQEIQEIERQMHHLIAAAENLYAIGLDEPADELMGQAEDFEHHLMMLMEEEGHDFGPDEKLYRHVEELTDMVLDLREEVHELREIVEHLQREIEKR